MLKAIFKVVELSILSSLFKIIKVVSKILIVVLFFGHIVGGVFGIVLGSIFGGVVTIGRHDFHLWYRGRFLSLFRRG